HAVLREQLRVLRALLLVLPVDVLAVLPVHAAGRGERVDGRDLDAELAGGDEAGHLVGVLVHLAAVRAADEVPAEAVIHVAVAVLVLAGVRDLALVDPDVVLQVLVLDVDPGVDDRHDDGARRLPAREKLFVGAAHAGADHAVPLAVEEPPLVGGGERRGRRPGRLGRLRRGPRFGRLFRDRGPVRGRGRRAFGRAGRGRARTQREREGYDGKSLEYRHPDPPRSRPSSFVINKMDKPRALGNPPGEKTVRIGSGRSSAPWQRHGEG